MEIQTSIISSIASSVQPSIQQTKAIVPDIPIASAIQSFAAAIVGEPVAIAAQPVDISSGITTDTPT